MLRNLEIFIHVLWKLKNVQEIEGTTKLFSISELLLRKRQLITVLRGNSDYLVNLTASSVFSIVVAL